MKRSLTGILFLLVLAVAGGIGFYAAEELRDGRSPAVSLAERSAEPEPAGAGAEPASAPAESETAAVPEPGAQPEEFGFIRLEVDTSKANPEACLVFSGDLDETGETRYEDYLTILPEAQPGLRIAGPLLCLQNLGYGQSLQVTLRKGLPAASGEVLAWEETIPVSLRDRPAALSFGTGIILPRGQGAGVPLTTVNVAEAEIQVFRVGDRLLSQINPSLLDSAEIYPYEESDIEYEKGALVWEGTMSVAGRANEDTLTLFPIREALPDRQPGVYLVTARQAKDRSSQDPYDYTPKASTWIIESDLGLTSFTGSGGLSVFARSLGTAIPESGLRLRLMARNNEILGEVKTDSSGMARFAPGLLRGHGGLEPVAVFAYGARGDFNYLDLRRPAFDLTDRGVGGRTAPGPVDAYLYTERGVYRPGERVELVAMLRDQRADAIADVPLTLIVSRPDGIEYRRYQDADQSAGAAHFEVDLTRSAPPGRWQARAYIDPKAAPVGRVAFDVQDFVPERLKIALTPQTEILTPGGPVELEVDAQFLYGAPAAGLEGEAELRLLVDGEPFPDAKGYDFGLVEELFSSKLQGLAVGVTGEDGKAKIAGTLEAFGETTKPLKALITVGLFEPGGRMTRERTTLKVRTRPLMIGLKPAFDGYSVRQNTEAAFDVIALDGEGVRQARTGLSWQIVKEIRHYQWYEVNGSWRYETVRRDRPVAAGNLDTGTEDPARIAKTLDWGTYRLAVRDEATGAASSTRFYVGWSGETADRPDRVSVTAEKETYRPGETALIEITPPTAGKALIVAASEKVHHSALIDVPESGARVFVPVTSDWGPGAYVMVSTYRPLGEGPDEAPVRAIGLTWIGVDQSDRTLDVAFTVPEIARPQQTLRMPVQVTGVEAGSEAFVTVAAVDEGILQLTDFASPAPTGHYYGKRRLGLEMRDDYGRLIRTLDGQKGPIRSGGDGEGGGEGLTIVPQRTVALFSGIVKLGAGGRANVPLEIPDYAGELRLMAVAFSKGRLGEAERPLTVREAVVGEVVLPRFLAPSDRADLTLNIHNVEGAAGDYAATLASDGKVSLGEAVRLQMSLKEGERREVALPLEGLEPGFGQVRLALKGPGGFQSERAWDIEVRPAQRAQRVSETQVIDPEASLTLDGSLVDAYLAGTASVDVIVGSTPGYDVPGLLRALDRYPYGCLEQTVSRAFPLLYFEPMATQVGIAADEGLQKRLQDAVDRVLDMQTSTGGFTMWGWGDREAAHWLSLYAAHFLSEARASEGLIVPETALRRALGFAAEIAGQSWRKSPQRAYAFYVLARAGRASSGDLRYFHDTERQNLKDIMSLGFLGAALAQVGDISRASGTFEAALSLANAANEDTYIALPYGSLLRDVAGLTALAAESGQIGALPALLEKSQTLSKAHTNTQEKAWMLFAARALIAARGEVDVAVLGADADKSADPFVVSPDDAELGEGVSITNTGDKPIWGTVTVQGVPKEDLPAEAKGVTLKKAIWTLTGGTPALNAVRQSDRLIVLLSGRMPDNDRREMAVMDLLPAGFEIEAVVTGDAKGRSAYGFLPGLTRTRSVQTRHDRFIAAFDIGSGRKPKDGLNPPKPVFNIAYVVRAITPGSFALPPAYVEDMYAPAIRARTGVKELTIVAAGE